MAKVTSCPEAGVWRALVRGELPVDQVEPLAAHLESCTQCITTLDSFPEWGLITPSLAENSEATPLPLEQVQQRLKQMSLLVQTTAGLEPTITASVRADLTFLEPAKSADELGWLGSFRILELLGEGGMGMVFRAEDTQLCRLVALKVMRPLLDEKGPARQRFLREARAAAGLHHDHILTIYQVGEANGKPYLASELLHGESLAARLQKDGRLPPPVVQELGRQIAAGLAAAHARGLIHRDIKPANLWLEPSGRLKILDFGLARVVEGEEQITQSGVLVGTPAYMAPEQAGEGAVDHRADLFSLGVVLYEMATGRRPFGGSHTLAVLGGILSRTPPRPHDLHPEIPPALSDLIMRLLDKDPAQRPATAQAVIDALEQLDTPVASKLVSSKPVAPRRWIGWLVAAACLLALLPLAWLYGGTLIRVATNKGELLVEVDDPEVDVKVIQDGVTIHDKTKQRTFTLKAGTGELVITDKDGLRVLAKEFILERGGKTIVKVTQKELAEARPVPKPRNPNPLDALDPKNIPAAERYDWQPKELVAVIGEQRMRAPGYAGNLAVSADGKDLLAVVYDGSIWCFDIPTGRRKWACHPEDIVSPDGKYHLRPLLPLPPEYQAKPPARPVWRSAEQSNDGSRTVTVLGGNPHVAVVRDFHGGQATVRDKIESPKNPKQAMKAALSNDGKTLAVYAGAEGKGVEIYDLSGTSTKIRLTLPAPKEWLSDLTFTPEGQLLVLADKYCRLWNISADKPEELTSFSSEYQLLRLRLSPQGKHLIIDEGAHCALYRLEHGKWTNPELISSDQRAEGPISAMNFTPDGNTLFLAFKGGAIFTFDLTRNHPTEVNPLRPRAILHPTVVSPDGRYIATPSGIAFKNLEIHDLKTPNGGVLTPARGDTFGMVLAFAPDSQTILTRMPDGPPQELLTEWRIEAAKVVPKRVLRMPSRIAGAAYSSDGKRIAVMCEKHYVEFDMQGKEPKETRRIEHSQPDQRYVFAPDLQSVVGYSLYGSRLLVVADNKLVEQLLTRGAENCQFAPDGKSMILCGAGVFRMDLSKKTVTELWRYDAQPCTAAVQSPDGKRLFVGVRNATLVEFDLEKGIPIPARSWKLAANARTLHVAADGRHVIALLANDVAYVLRLEQ